MNGLYIEADNHKMEQVLRNLLSNAVKFSPRGGVVQVKLSVILAKEKSTSIRVTPVPSSDLYSASDCFLQIDVTDSGVGISKVRQSLIEMYFSAHCRGLSPGKSTAVIQ